MANRFQLEKHGSTVAAELLAGTTSFLAISYILVINPLVLAETGMPFVPLYVATALTAGVSTIILGLYANLPYAMAPAMGLNVFFSQTLCIGLGFAWQEALCLAFLAGALHAALMISPARRSFVRGFMPRSILYAGLVGMGSFITVGGLRYAGLSSIAHSGAKNVAFDPSAHVDMISPVIGKFSYSNFIAILGIVFIVGLLALERKNKACYAAFPVGVLAATFFGIPLGVTALAPAFIFDTEAFGEFRSLFFALSGDPGLLSLLQSPERLVFGLALGLCTALICVTDSIVCVPGLGTLGFNQVLDQTELDEFAGVAVGGPNRIDRAFVANSLGGMTGAVFGCCPAVVYAESSIGIAAKGRTGLTALVCGILFLVCMPLGRLLHILPAEAVGATLILGGVFPLSQAGKIDWGDFAEAIPAGLVILVMIATSDLIAAIGLGMVCHIVYQAVSGNRRSLNPLLLAMGAMITAAAVFMHLLKFN